MNLYGKWLQRTFHRRQKDPSSPHKRRRVFTQRGTTLVGSMKEPTSDIASKLLATSPDHGGHPFIPNSCCQPIKMTASKRVQGVLGLRRINPQLSVPET